jgi:polysaccharide deacetylase 2 family uncharacterized protein YibQ
MYDIKFYAYCGMSYEIANNLTADEVKKKLREMFASARKSGSIVSHIRKNTWEIETPEDAVMVADDEGIVKVIKVVKRLKRSLY